MDALLNVFFSKSVLWGILFSLYLSFSPSLEASVTVVNEGSSVSSTSIKKVSHHYSAYPASRPGMGVPVFIFNPKTHIWALYNSSGKLLKTGKGSGGKSYCPDVKRACRTPSGTFHVIAKKGAACKSSKYPLGKGGAPMPYCTFFTKNHGIHGSYDVPNYNASHGCIRVRPTDAKWIQSMLPMGSIVIVRPYY